MDMKLFLINTQKELNPMPSKPLKTNNIKLTIADLDKAINEQALKIQSNANNKDYNPSGDELYLSRLFHVRNTNVLDCLENNQDVLLAEIKKNNKLLAEIKAENTKFYERNNDEMDTLMAYINRITNRMLWSKFIFYLKKIKGVFKR
jgi:hypothetical protein